MGRQTKKAGEKAADVNVVDTADVVSETKADVITEEVGVDISEMMLDATDENDTSVEDEVETEEVNETPVADETVADVDITYDDIQPDLKVTLINYKLEVTAAAAKAIIDKAVTEKLTDKDVDCIASFKYWKRNGNNFSLDVKA